MEMSTVGLKEEARAGRSGAWMDYRLSKNYAPTFSSFAWAQAVQNKPLGLELMPTGGADLAAKNDSCDVISAEGALEEGEIEVGSEQMMTDEMTEVSVDDQEKELAKKESDGEESHVMGDFDKLVSLILKKLEAITVEEAEASFEDICLRLRKVFEELKLMFTGKESSDTVLHALTQQAFVGIQTVYSVLHSIDLQKREQHKQLMLRLLFHIKNQYSTLLTSEQVQEMDALAYSLVFTDNDKDKDKKKCGGIDNSNLANLCKEPKTSSGSVIFLERPNLAPKAVHSSQLKLSLPRNEVEFDPMLNLHAAYDEESLPSPTRENASQYPPSKPISLGMVPVLLSQPIAVKAKETEGATLQSHVTCSHKDATFCQQKYRNFMLNNQLESLTPSEEGDEEDDSHEEVSSSLVAGSAITSCIKTQFHGIKSSTNVAPTNNSNMDQPGPASLVDQVASGTKHVLKSAFPSRDPRLRFLNNEMKGLPDFNGGIITAFAANGLVGGTTSTKKHKIVSDSVAGDHTMKRQRSENKSIIAQVSDRNEKSQVEVIKPGLEQVSSDRTADSSINSGVLHGLGPNLSNPSPTKSLLPFLKTVNPTILCHLLQTEQKRSEIENQKDVSASECDATNVSNCNGLPREDSSANAVPESKRAGQNQPLLSYIPAQPVPMSSQNDIGRVRMKSRDPRRILQNNMTQMDEAQELTKKNPTVSGSQLTATLTGPRSNNEPISSKANQVDVKPALAELNSPKIASAVSARGSAEGASVSSDPWGDVGHFLDGYNNEQKEAIQRERARRIAEQNKMFAARKLCLVLDLDHTLLNSAKFVEVDPFLEEVLRKKEEKEKEKPQQHLFRLQHMGMWTKLRPGIWNFLEKASKLFELHVYTMGNKTYATEMAKLLDPTGSLFAGRVISRGDDGDHFGGDEKVPKSKDLDGVLGLESAVVIIDDTLRVWPHNKLNLILVERYTYFPSSRRQFGLHGPSLLQIDHDERPEDGTLAISLAVIERIHQNFFSHPSIKHADVRSILAAEQRKVLAGCRIIFSRIFPVGEANPHLHPLWQTAEQFGAVCTNRMDERVTHVVANSPGTDKVNWALSTGRFVVHPSWVEASALLYRRAKEHEFAVRTLR